MELHDILGIAAVPAITVICYLVAEAVKLTELREEWLPVICGVSGGVLGVVALFFAPALIPAADVLSAVAIGIVSGLAATGAHQIGKQLSKLSDKVNTNMEDD